MIKLIKTAYPPLSYNLSKNLGRGIWNLSKGTGTNQIATFSDLGGSSKECITFGDLPYGGKTAAGASNKCVKYSALITATFTFTVMISCMNALDSGTFSSPSNGLTQSWSGSGDYFVGHSNDVISVAGTATSGNWTTSTYLGVTISEVDSSNKFTVNSKGTYTSAGTLKSNEISISPTSTSSAVNSIFCNASITLVKDGVSATVTFYLELSKSGSGGGIVLPDTPTLQ